MGEVRSQRHRVEVTRALREAAQRGDEGNFEDAQQVLTVCEQKLEQGKRTAMTTSLCLELKDAHQRLRSRSVWEHGGRAEVNDACWMHSVQRCTNMTATQSFGFEKMSKSMYCTQTQRAWGSK